jgi:hypothetical protein
MITRRQLLGSAAGTLALGLSASCTKGIPAPPTELSESESIVPRSKAPARKLIVAAAHRLGPDETTAFAVLQGLINRTQPQVYLVYDVEDAFWLNWLRERGDIEAVEWVGRYEVFRRFRDRIRGCIVTDPSLPASINVGMLLGSINDWMVVSPDLLSTFDLPIKEDLRGRWKQSADAYRWAYDNLFPSACKQVLSHMNPYGSRLRDYMTEFKVFTFWLSGTDDENGRKEIALAREVFERVGPNIPILGWWDSHGRGKPSGISEGPGVDLIAEYGLFTDCMDWDGQCEGTSNVSVHSGTRATFKQKPAPPPPKLENKVYYSFLRTDGDGTNFWRQEFLTRWQDPQHGQVPVNWPVGPLACDFIPDIMDYFYKHASDNDYFMVAVSGIGYTRENLYGARLSPELRKKAFDHFLRLTARYMKRMDLHHVHTHKTSSDALAREYAHIEGLEGLFLNYDREPETTAETATATINGVPVFHSVIVGPEVKGTTWDAKAKSAEGQLRRFTPAGRPAFLHFTLTNWNIGDSTRMESFGVLQRIRRDLSPEYVAVRADHLVRLYKDGFR